MVACSHSEVSLELNCVQCVSPPQLVTQGTGRLSPAKGGKEKTHKEDCSLSFRPLLHTQTPAARGQSHNDVRSFFWMPAKDTFHSVVSCFFVCHACIVAFQSLVLHIDTPSWNIWLRADGDAADYTCPELLVITDDLLDVLQEHRGPALNSSDLWKLERRRPGCVFVHCSVWFVFLVCSICNCCCVVLQCVGCSDWQLHLHLGRQRPWKSQRQPVWPGGTVTHCLLHLDHVFSAASNRNLTPFLFTFVLKPFLQRCVELNI